MRIIDKKKQSQRARPTKTSTKKLSEKGLYFHSAEQYASRQEQRCLLRALPHFPPPAFQTTLSFLAPLQRENKNQKAKSQE